MPVEVDVVGPVAVVVAVAFVAAVSLIGNQ